MLLIECEQGDAMWHSGRAGAITASMFKVARERVGGLNGNQQRFVDAYLGAANGDEMLAAEIAGYKNPRAKGPESLKHEKVAAAIRGESVGEFSEAAKNYAFRLAVERISWQPLNEGFDTWAMQRGRELEPEARAAHAERIGQPIQRAGIVLTDDERFGASADGLIGENGGAEYKCLVAPDRMREIILDHGVEEFRDQIQGCMWLTGRSWWHFVLYCPALASIGRDLIIHEQPRDEAYIEALREDLLAFDALVMEYQAGIEASESYVPVKRNARVESKGNGALPPSAVGIF